MVSRENKNIKGEQVEKNRIRILRETGVYPRGCSLGDAIERYGSKGRELFSPNHQDNPLIGEKRGHWTVIKDLGASKKSIHTYLCRCDCGAELKKTKSVFKQFIFDSCCGKCQKNRSKLVLKEKP